MSTVTSGSVGRHGPWRRRAAGALVAAGLMAGYLAVLRPARLWTAEHVAYPVLQSVDTPHARQFEVVQWPGRPDAVIAVPRAVIPPGRAATEARWSDRYPQWAAPAGVIFLLPALFLGALFPARPYWLYLLAYHVALGLVAFGIFAAGLAGWAPAFKVYTFARTYLAETVSLVVPLLLALAARAQAREAHAAVSSEGQTRPPTTAERPAA